MSFDFSLSEYFPDGDDDIKDDLKNEELISAVPKEDNKNQVKDENDRILIEKPVQNENLPIIVQGEDLQIKKAKKQKQEKVADILNDAELEKLLAKVIPIEIYQPNPFSETHQKPPKLQNVIETEPFQFNAPLQSLSEQFKEKLAQLEHADALIAKIVEEQEKLKEYNKKLKEEVEILSPRTQEIVT